MSATPIDYQALADQARKSAPVDYAALARQARGQETPSLWEQAKANFNANTQHVPVTGPMSVLQNFGATAGDSIRFLGARLHDPLGNEIHARTGQEIVDEGQRTIEHPINAMAEAVGGAAPLAILGAAGAKVVENVSPTVSRIPQAVTQAKAGFAKGAYPENVSIPAKEAATQTLVKALIPDNAAIPNIKSAAPELSDALASAKKKGVAVNGKLDAAQVLRDRAGEVQAHYNDTLLRPHAGDINTVADNYNGDTAGGSNKATLSQINDRVDAINSELKSNFRKKLASQTTEANASDADLIAEKQGLTKILHDRLAELNGLQPEDIADVRQRAGKLRSLAQEVEVSADRDTVAQGRRDTSGGPLSIKNPLEAVREKLGGGLEIIGNRVFRSALDGFEPVEKPLPQPAPLEPGTAVTPEMAQQEFLHKQQLEQTAQDAATERAKQAAAARSQIGSPNRNAGISKWSQAGQRNLAEHIAQNEPGVLNQADLDKLAQTDQGRMLLVQAGSLQPGSAMMKSVLSRAKGALGK